MNIKVVLYSIFLLSLLFAPSLFAATCFCNSCIDCSTKLNDPICDKILLTSDTSSPGSCIVQSAALYNKTFDCQGHSLVGSNTLASSGIYLRGANSSNITFSNCIISDFYYGAYFFHTLNLASIGNSIQNSTFFGNEYGIYAVAPYSRFSSIIAYENNVGVQIDGYIDNRISGIQAWNNTNALVINTATNTLVSGANLFDNENAIVITLSHSTNISSSTISKNTEAVLTQGSTTALLDGFTVYSNSKGFTIANSTNITINNARTYNNSLDYSISATSGPTSINIINTTLDSPFGLYTNFTRFSLSDNLATLERYFINWSSSPVQIPYGLQSFQGKFMDISGVAGSPSIYNLVLFWNDSETANHTESQFSLQRYNGIDWTALNYTPDTDANSLSVSNVVLFSTFGILEPSQAASAEWPLFMRWPDRTAWDGIRYPTVPGLNLATFETNDQILSSPAVANGYVYIASWSGYLYQLNASNISMPAISSFLTGNQLFSSPAVANGYVYLGGGSDTYVYQLNASNISQKITSFKTGGEVLSSPAVANGYLYVGSHDGYLYQLNASNINQQIARYRLWSRFSSPAVANGYVYVTSQYGNLSQLNASNISQLPIATFTIQPSSGLWSPSSPAVANGYVYAAAFNGTLYQCNASNVSQYISNFTASGQIVSSPAVANGYVYIGTGYYNKSDNKVYQLNASNISQKISEYITDNVILSSPAVANGYVYVGSADSKIYQLNASNISQHIANFTTGNYIESSAAVANGYVYVGSADKKVYQLNASNISIINPCACSSCEECTAFLNSSNCTFVSLATNINSTTTCIDNPEYFINKTFDCQNNSITGSKSGSGIYLFNKSNANNIIQNCRISNFSNAIYLDNTSSNLFDNLYISGSQYAIRLKHAEKNNFSNALAEANSFGVYTESYRTPVYNDAVDFAQFNRFSNMAFNDGQYCLYLQYTGNNVFQNVSCSGASNTGLFLDGFWNLNFTSINLSNNAYGVDVEGSKATQFPFVGLISFTDSYVNEKPIYSYDSSADLTVPQDAGFVIICNSTNLTVENQLFTKNGDGIVIFFSINLKLNNITANSNRNGLYIRGSSNTQLSNITAYSNSQSGITTVYSYSDACPGGGNDCTYSGAERLDRITAYLNPTGVHFGGTRNNILTNGILYNNTNYDLYVAPPAKYGSTSATVIDTLLANSTYGAYFERGFNGGGDKLTNITAFGNRYGIYADYNQMSAGRYIYNSTFYENTYGIYLNSHYNKLFNILTYNNSNSGIAIRGTYNSFSNITSFSNKYGLVIGYASDNNIVANSSFYENTYRGILVQASNNQILNINSSFNSIGISLEHGGSNTISNCTASFNGQGFYIYGASNSLTNSTAYNNSMGVYIGTGSCAGEFWRPETKSNTLSNLILSGNSQYGVYETCANNTRLSNSVLHDNGYGIYLDSQSLRGIFSNLEIHDSSNTGITVVGKPSGGFGIHSPDNNSFSNITIYNNQKGAHVENSKNTYFNSIHYFNNGLDLLANSTAISGLLSIQDSVFDNSKGNFANYTNLSLQDEVSAELYSISWNSAPDSPVAFKSFENKFVNISRISGSPSIDYAEWHWPDSELTVANYTYNETKFMLFKFDSSWSLLNSSPNTVQNTLSISNITNFSTFGILEKLYCPCSSCEECNLMLNDSTCDKVVLISNITSIGTCINNPENFIIKTFDCQNNLITGS
ncbi:PQQ-binding-like beta-propeller repeat protein, partial [Candidatus Micrarchaeota archaeon]|nr:PQQ-binding-like beta-propeller repeat protein [Candidatus Micrarchaeota archaeon]